MKVSRFRPLRVLDFYDLEVQPRHQYLMPVFRSNPLLLQSLADDPFSFTMVEDGKPVASCGVLPNGALWILFGPDMKRHMLRFVRYGLAMMRIYGRPTWAEIDRTNKHAVRLALTAGLRKVKIAPKGVMDIWAYYPNAS